VSENVCWAIRCTLPDGTRKWVCLGGESNYAPWHKRILWADRAEARHVLRLYRRVYLFGETGRATLVRIKRVIRKRESEGG